VEDGWVLTKEEPAHEVPVIDGMVAGDVGLLDARRGGRGPEPNTTSTYEAYAKNTYGDLAVEFLALYPAPRDADVAAMRKASGTDRMRVSIDVWSKAQLNRSSAIYTYYFDRPIPWPAHPQFGAFHTSEVPYVFQVLKVLDRPWTNVDFTLSDEMSSYWTNFAKTGNPNGPGLPKWAPYDPNTHTTMELGERVGPLPEADGAKLKFFLKYFKN
jgi:para-nitrobenzyl esterase